MGSNSLLLILFGIYKTISDTNASFEHQKKIITNPIVVNTWPFINATKRAWSVLNKTDDPMLAVELGCHECEILRCDGTVGYGGSPDESGSTTLDAMIMDGRTHDVGAVAGLKNIRSAISVARAVMNYTTHTLLVGDAATKFAIEMGFKYEETHSVESMQLWIDWYKRSCQPNYRINVEPNPSTSCGPYFPSNAANGKKQRFNRDINEKNHDTIGMIAIDSNGNIAGGTSTNGASHKVPGYFFLMVLKGKSL
jgi:N4-(beta-N-acetylglucosaminyl)-L-asparaginase